MTSRIWVVSKQWMILDCQRNLKHDRELVSPYKEMEELWKRQKREERLLLVSERDRGIIKEVRVQLETERENGMWQKPSEMPRSELCVWVSVASAACRALAGLHKDALRGLPQAVLAGARHGVNFHLTVDRATVLLPRYRQQRVSRLVEETDGLLALPHRSSTLNCPFIQMITFPFFAKSTDLLMRKRHGIYDNQVFILWKI